MWINEAYTACVDRPIIISNSAIREMLQKVDFQQRPLTLSIANPLELSKHYARVSPFSRQPSAMTFDRSVTTD